MTLTDDTFYNFRILAILKINLPSNKLAKLGQQRKWKKLPWPSLDLHLKKPLCKLPNGT